MFGKGINTLLIQIQPPLPIGFELSTAKGLARDEFQRQWMAVLSGVGAKEYYREFGYSAQGAYMVKRL